MHRKTGAKVYIRRRDHKPQWFDVWDNIPYILRRPVPGCEIIVHGGGQRPYIDTKAADRWTWKRYAPHPAEIVFTAAELAFAAPHAGRVMIEPNGKNSGGARYVEGFGCGRQDARSQGRADPCCDLGCCRPTLRS